MRRANRELAALLLLDVLRWRETPRDRLINALLIRRSRRYGPHMLESVFARRRPGREPAKSSARLPKRSTRRPHERS